MNHPKITVHFDNLGEVRMGSPYNLATLRIDGSWNPGLRETDWQDIHAHSESGRYHALVRWDYLDGAPGFRLFLLDAQKKKVFKSDRMEGCCSSVEWRGTGFSFQTFRYLAEKDFSDLEEVNTRAEPADRGERG